MILRSAMEAPKSSVAQSGGKCSTFDGVRVEDLVKYALSAIGIAGVTRTTVDAQNASTTKVYELHCTQQIHDVNVPGFRVK